MIITAAALASVSAIPMASDAPAPTFLNVLHHPMIKSLSTSQVVRDNQIFMSPMVEGVIIIQNNNPTVICFPKKTQDLIHDPDGAGPILIGAVGSSLSSATPVSVPTRLIFQDFATDPIPVPHSPILAKTLFSDHQDKHQHSLSPLSTNDVHCIRLPDR